MKRDLRLGHHGPDVLELKQRLLSLGYSPTKRVTNDRFDQAWDEAVRFFQQTHLDRRGKNLKPDGIVGSETDWALAHPNGLPQRSGLLARLPEGLEPLRTAHLALALEQHGIVEDPIGSNRGDHPNGGVDKFIPKWALSLPGPKWCCFFWSWVHHNASEQPLFKVHGSCSKAWEAAVMLGLAQTDVRQIRPGDAFLLKGFRHIGYVLQLSEDGREINTVEGNCANRVKIGRRNVRELEGVIDMVPDEHGDGWQRGLLLASSSAADPTH